jgi:hypothetical protein
MNRQERRAAAKKKGPPERIESEPAIEGPQEPPSLLLRMFARVVLSPWVLNRVSHPEVERLLVSLAIQVGEPEKARSLANRMNMRAERR